MNINAYLRLMRMDKPVGSLLLLYPALFALFVVTNGTPDILNLVTITLGVFITRSAGCILNDIADRNIDKHVARTKLRPLATGEISVFKAIILFISLAALGVLLLLGFFPVRSYPYAFLCVVLMGIYPLSKRFLKIPQVILGFAFSMPILFVYGIYFSNPFSQLNFWLLFIGNLAWIIAYDTQYAIRDLDDDLKLGNVNSSAIFFGDKVNFWVAGFNLIFIIAYVALGVVNKYGTLYFSILAINLVIFVYHFFFVDDTKPETGFTAFMQNLYVGLVTTVALVFGLIGSLQNQIQIKDQQIQELQRQLVAVNSPSEPETDPTPTPQPEPETDPAPEKE